MSEVEWGQYQQAYKAIHDKITEVLAKLDNPSNPAVFDLINNINRLLGLSYSSIANLGNIPNPSFEMDWYGWITTATNLVDDGVGPTGKCCEFYQSLTSIYTPIIPSVPTDYIKDFVFLTKSDATSGGNLMVYVFYSDGTNKITTISEWFQLPIPPYTPLWFMASIGFDLGKFVTGIAFFCGSLGDGTYIRVDDISLSYETPIQIKGEATPITAVINSTGDNTIATPTAGQRLYIKKIQISNRSANLEPRVSFKFTAAGAEHFPITLAGYGTEVIDLVGMNWKGGIDESLIAVRDGVNATVDCTIMKVESAL